jgi:hypothetical protein
MLIVRVPDRSSAAVAFGKSFLICDLCGAKNDFWYYPPLSCEGCFERLTNATLLLDSDEHGGCVGVQSGVAEMERASYHFNGTTFTVYVTD